MSREEIIPGYSSHAETGQDQIKTVELDELSRIIADSSPVGVYIVQDGKFLFVNPQFRIGSAYTEGELLMRNPLEIVLSSSVRLASTV